MVCGRVASEGEETVDVNRDVEQDQDPIQTTHRTGFIRTIYIIPLVKLKEHSHNNVMI